MSRQTVRVIALFKAKPGKTAALKDFLTQFIEPTLKEKGCIQYELHQNTADESDFCFIEEWESHETLDAHLASPHITIAAPLLGSYILGNPDIRRYTLSK